MGVSSEKKLQLVKMIRDEQQNNRAAMQNRESFLYGKSFLQDPLQNSTTAERGTMGEVEKSGQEASTFSLRFLISVLLLIGFLMWNNSDIEIMGRQADEIYPLIQDERLVRNVFDFIEDIPYTLEDSAATKNTIKQ